MTIPADPTPALQEYARPEKLVTTQWLADRLAAGDTDGAPSLGWRARRAAKDARREARHLAKDARREAKHLAGAARSEAKLAKAKVS